MSKTKRLYVLRHGNAQAYGFDKDAFRELTPLGVEEVIATAGAFREKGDRLDAVFVSPYIRAQQTAQHFLTELNQINDDNDSPLEGQTCQLITPSGKALDVALWLNEQPYESILLVTHQPFAYQLVDLLSDAPLPHDFSMMTASLAALEGELFATACCQFRWFITQ